MQIPAAVLWGVGEKWKVEPVVTARSALDDINEGYADMHAGKNLRGVVLHDS